MMSVLLGYFVVVLFLVRWESEAVKSMLVKAYKLSPIDAVKFQNLIEVISWSIAVPLALYLFLDGIIL